MNQTNRRILIRLVTCLTLSACSHGPPNDSIPSGTSTVGNTFVQQMEEDENTKPEAYFSPCECEPGNSNNNYSTHGCFAEKDGWVYFVDRSKGGLLSRKRMDDSGLMNYNEKPVSSINVVGDWIYYQKRSHLDKSLIYRMKIDGSESEKISPILSDYNSCSNFIVRGEYIYFSNFEDHSSLYRMKTDGSDVVKLNDVISYSLNMDGDWIYYVRMDKRVGFSNELRKIRADGSQDTFLADETCTTILPYKEWIYYIGAESGSKPLYRIRKDGTDKMQVVKDDVCGINIHEDQLFYVTQKAGLLYSSSLDGSKSRQLMEERAYGPHIAGGWLYFANVDEMNRPYRIRLDGTGLEKAYSVKSVEETPDLITSQGLGVANANSLSRFVRSGDWIYFSLDSYQGEIRKMLRNGNSHSTVAKVPGTDLNIVGHWLYFIDTSVYDSLARVRIDGTGYGTILDQSAAELIVLDEWMYFINRSDQNRIYRVKVDGSNLTQLTDEPARNLQLDKAWLFYEPSQERDNQGEEGIYKVKLDGSEHRMVSDQAIERMTVSDDWIYYTTEENDQLRCMTTSGAKDQAISDEAGNLHGVYDGWIYWFSTSEDKGMFRMELNGDNKSVILGPGSYSLVHFLEDKIVYFDNDKNMFHLMERDGNLRREFTP